MQWVSTTELIPRILVHASRDASFSDYCGRWMLQSTLTTLLNEHYCIPEALSFTEGDLSHALSGWNQKILNEMGLGTITERNFGLNTCGIYRSDYHTTQRKIKKRAFFIVHGVLDGKVNPSALVSSSPWQIIQGRTHARPTTPPVERMMTRSRFRKKNELSSPPRLKRNIIDHGVLDDKVDPSALVFSSPWQIIQGRTHVPTTPAVRMTRSRFRKKNELSSPPRLKRNLDLLKILGTDSESLTQVMDSSEEGGKRKRNHKDPAQWADAVGVRKSKRSKMKADSTVGGNKVVQTVNQPMTSSAKWFTGLLEYHILVTRKLETHEPVEIPSSATSLQNCIAVALERSASNSRKEAALRHVSEDAFSSNQTYYWFSNDAIKLFQPDAEPGTNIYDILQERVLALKKALHSPIEFFKLIEGNPKNDDDISLHNMKMLRVKMVCVKRVTEQAILLLGTGDNNFQKCCEKVIDWTSTISDIPEYPTHFETVRRWHAEFRTHKQFLLGRHPAKDVPLPRMLMDFPEHAMAIRRFVKTNLDGLTAEKVRDYVNDTIFPKMLSSILDKNDVGLWDNGNSSREIRSITMKELLQHYGLQSFSISTTVRWMKALGMSYNERKKNYYVDGHEREDVIISRWKFISQYLKREMQMHRWVHLTEKEVQDLNERGTLIEDHGYHFTDESTGETMYEFHVDAHHSFQQRCKDLEFGGNLSVRKDPNSKIIISLGHDESIFNMFSFTKSCWNGCDGEQPIVPKDNGTGIMYSCIQSREFGFGFRRLTEDELERVNSARRGRDKFYQDTDAAKVVFGGNCLFKKKFTIDDNPFVRSFEYGANKDGYWTYDHLIVQLEDVMDILCTLYDSEKYEFQFLVDHSCGHDRQRPDGLNIFEMNSFYGGKQRRVHNSTMVEGCLGTNDPILKLGDTQSMIFTGADDGPFYMPENERQKLKEGNLLSSKFINIDKNTLIKTLFRHNIFHPGTTTISIADKQFQINHLKQTIYAPDKLLPFRTILSLCRARNVNIDDIIDDENDHCNEEDKENVRKRIIDSIQGTTFKFRTYQVRVDRVSNQLWQEEVPISPEVVRKICRGNNISWRKEVRSESVRKTVDKTVKELYAALTSAGHHIPKTERRLKAHLVKWALHYDISIKKDVDTNVTETWVDKPKGKLQVAWERGLLNLEKYCIEDFSEKGKMDEYGHVICDTSLDMLLSKCSDFLEEKSLLQLNLEKLGATCYHSPKFHCELAGEGIEYSWGNAKLAYRRVATKEKNTVSKFHQRVKESLSRTHLTTERIRYNSTRARDYILTYFIASIEKKKVKDGEFITVNELKPCAIDANRIEKMRCNVRVHRAAIDFDRAFCEATVRIKRE